MKKLKLIIISIILAILFYAIWFRIYMSNFYEKWLINNHVFSWEMLTISWSKNYIETVFYPLKDQTFKIQIIGANVIWFFFVYDILWWKEYKISSSIQTLPWNIFEINDSQKIFFDSEVWITNILRNSFLDKGWKLIWVSIQLAPISWNNITIKNIYK